MTTSSYIVVKLQREASQKLCVGVETTETTAMRMDNASAAALDTSASDSGRIIEGIFLALTHPQSVRSEMSSYYEWFANRSVPHQREPIWSVPYTDANGLGSVMSCTLPVYFGNKFVGVVGVDITLEETFGVENHLNPTDLSYFFAINEDGIVISYPSMKSADDEQLFVEATALERSPEFVEVFESMKRGESGIKVFTSQRTFLQGDTRKYSIRTQSINSTYLWRQIPGTTFSICLVLAARDVISFLNPQGPLPRGGFYYHRMDLKSRLNNDRNACANGNSLAVKDISSTFLAANVFTNSLLRRYNTETINDVFDLTKFMEGSGRNTMLLKESTRDEVMATAVVDELWKEPRAHDEKRLNVMWRILATRSGVVRLWPASQLPRDLNPATRPWYENAVANKGDIIVTPPHKSVIGGKIVVTFSKALFENAMDGGLSGRQYSNYFVRHISAKFDNMSYDATGDRIFGVLAGDMLVSNLRKYMNHLYKECADFQYRCILMDRAGYVIVYGDESMLTEEHVHITQIDPKLGSALIRDYVMMPMQCSDVKSATVLRTYEVSPTAFAYNGTTGARSCRSFEFMPIVNTNIYLIVSTVQETESDRCRISYRTTCSCDTTEKRLCMEEWKKGKFCECPCAAVDSSYQLCENNYKFTRSSPSPCARRSSRQFFLEQSVDLQTFPACSSSSDLIYVTRVPDHKNLSTVAAVVAADGDADGSPGIIYVYLVVGIIMGISAMATAMMIYQLLPTRIRASGLSSPFRRQVRQTTMPTSEVTNSTQLQHTPTNVQSPRIRTPPLEVSVANSSVIRKIERDMMQQTEHLNTVVPDQELRDGVEFVKTALEEIETRRSSREDDSETTLPTVIGAGGSSTTDSSTPDSRHPHPPNYFRTNPHFPSLDYNGLPFDYPPTTSRLFAQQQPFRTPVDDDRKSSAARKSQGHLVGSETTRPDADRYNSRRRRTFPSSKRADDDHAQRTPHLQNASCLKVDSWLETEDYQRSNCRDEHANSSRLVTTHISEDPLTTASRATVFDKPRRPTSDDRKTTNASTASRHHKHRRSSAPFDSKRNFQADAKQHSRRRSSPDTRGKASCQVSINDPFGCGPQCHCVTTDESDTQI